MPVPQVSELNQARATFTERGNNWAANACHDMALKLTKYGKYASDKQQAFFAKLVTEAAAPACDKQKPHNTIINMPNITKALKIAGGKFHRLEITDLTIVCKADNSFAWIINQATDKAIGKIEPLACVANVWSTDTAIHDALRAFEADPITIASAFGRATGRCCCCGRTLTNPDSIAAGIGPICAAGF